VTAGVPEVSVIVPVRNDAAALTRLLSRLKQMNATALEVIVVDGGSEDDSAAVAGQLGATVVSGPPSRGTQLNAGFRAARGHWIWMLHADTQVSRAALTFIRSLRAPGWGRFDVAFEPNSAGMRVVAALMNGRSRLSGICTGDQGIFCERRLLERIGGIPEQPLMEDVELCRRLKALSRPIASRVRLTTSARRWRRQGYLRTIIAMWALRLRYWLGERPDVLVRNYYG
jgi:rSAM/selenodomain-associated transferase 2